MATLYEIITNVDEYAGKGVGFTNVPQSAPWANPGGPVVGQAGEDNYSSMWFDTTFWDPEALPTEAELRSHSDEVDLKLAVSAKVAQVTAERDRRLNVVGFDDTANTGKLYQTDPVSQGKIAAVGTLAGFAVMASQAENFEFIAADNQTVTMTAQEAFDWSKRVATWVSDTMLYANSLKNQARSAADVATVNAIDHLAGWP